MIVNSEGRISPADRDKLRANRAAKREHLSDIAAAERLRRASSLPKPKLGPRIAR